MKIYLTAFLILIVSGFCSENIPTFIEMKISSAILGGLGVIKEKTTFEKIKMIFTA